MHAVARSGRVPSEFKYSLDEKMSVILRQKLAVELIQGTVIEI